ncbi:16S rRNA (cytidine(1402)-2'-O)-methyltransferase [Pelagibacteraceae bacterium]|jgi:16S rRNA (cytidine1402-2'-O)-methyltransferase|nr:16S rRNA (cytidine(1402)-2'-O)-methyltransferase [Pelagibacteraceae bacterium]|tara:strand:+ start:246 stop:1088 length:843 start_codon:yes stop_codon:yes gene_type:complete
MNSFKPGLYIVSTPIGNLDDITLRALNVLKKSDIILCEDTRRSLKLLNHFNIKKKLISYHKFNEKKELHKIVGYLNEGKILSLISDAGTPTLSDPGSLLVKKCVEKEISIYPIPGPSSITASASISGFEDQFLFYGFLPKKEKELEKSLSYLKNLKFSIIFFIPGLKVNFYLKKFKEFFIERDILIAREITKIHETFYRSSIKEISLFKDTLKGELTIVISSKKKEEEIFNIIDINNQALKYLKKYSLKDVVDLISKKEKVSKKTVYELCLKIKNNEKIN